MMREKLQMNFGSFTSVVESFAPSRRVNNIDIRSGVWKGSTGGLLSGRN